MYLIHFTENSKWDNIRSDGFIRPKNQLQKHPTGGNTDMVSAFKGFAYGDQSFVEQFKKVFCKLNNINSSTDNIVQEGVVGLLIEPSGIDWVEYPKDKQEISLVAPSLDMEKLGIYVKTREPIPVSKVINTL